MKTAIDQAIELLISTQNFQLYNTGDFNRGKIDATDYAIDILQKLRETELDQLRAAYNNSCHEISFDEYYRNKYERKEQISPKDMGDNKEA